MWNRSFNLILQGLAQLAGSLADLVVNISCLLVQIFEAFWVYKYFENVFRAGL